MQKTKGTVINVLGMSHKQAKVFNFNLEKKRKSSIKTGRSLYITIRCSIKGMCMCVKQNNEVTEWKRAENKEHPLFSTSVMIRNKHIQMGAFKITVDICELTMTFPVKKKPGF